jgi:hypothetical protein
MRHASPQEDRIERIAMPPPAPMYAPLNWRSDVGLSSQSSGTEVVYDSPEEYEEDPRSPSPSPATKKRQHAELEKDMDEISTWSDEYHLGMIKLVRRWGS